jgi:hypothetical protein
MAKLQEYYVFVSEDASGEGLIAFKAMNSKGEAVFLPLSTHNKEQAQLQLAPLAREIGQLSGQKVTLVKFSTREDVQVIQDGGLQK